MHHADFVHLHVHTDYSILDGSCKISRLLDLVHNYKMPALAITDHGNMFGVVDFYQQVQRKGIKPIIGYEAYIAPGSRFDKKAKGIHNASFHITLLAKNEQGYRNLMKLTTIGFMEGFYYRPRIDLESLFKYKEGIVVLSGCMKSELSHYCLTDRDDLASNFLDKLTGELGKEDFYIELHRNNIPEQKIISDKSIMFAKEKGIKLVASNDIHYLNKEDAFAHEVMLCIQTGKTMDDDSHMKFSTDEFYVKSPDEMKKLFSDVPDSIANTIEIAEKCNVEIDFNKRLLPSFEIPSDKTEEQYFREICYKNLPEKYPNPDDKVKERLEFELKTIIDMGFPSYFLIVSDFVHYAKTQGIPVGPGRGSAAGSIVSYLLDITTLDPLKYDLLFERFLNPARITMPDIDIDFCKDGREKVIEYVTNKYGRDKVAQIITFGTMAAKMVIRDVGRVLDVPLPDVDKIAKYIPDGPKVKLKKSIEEVPELKKLYTENVQYKKLFDTALKLEGLIRQTGIHAAGIVIGDEELVSWTPLYMGGQEVTTQYEGGVLESIGLLKMDFLGLKTLTVISDACKIIEKTQNKKIDINKLPLDDKKTYELLNNAKTIGIFQLESDGMRNLAKSIGVDSFEVILALLALYRPGPLDWAPDFVARKHGTQEIEYDHPIMEEILKETYGVMLYQEQVMQVVNKLAGFTLAEADLLRRAMGKKKEDVMAAQRKKFISGAKKYNKIEPALSDKIFDNIFKFAGYGFNKSHSAAYAMISYQTAYLKSNYPVEFMAALLSSEMDNSDKIVRYIQECKQMGINILPPDINESFIDFTVVKDGIRFGFAAIKNVGENAIVSIINTRKEKGSFKSLYELCERVEMRTVNRRVLESLIKSGTFDSFGKKRSQLNLAIDNALDAASNVQKDLKKGQKSLFDIFEKQEDFAKEVEVYQEIDEWPENQKLALEKESLGFYITGHPLAEYENILKLYTTENSNTLLKYQDAQVPKKDNINFKYKEDGQKVFVGGIITEFRSILTRKADKMAFVKLEDLEGTTEVIVFPAAFDKYSEFVQVDMPVFIEGRVSINRKSDAVQVTVSKMLHLKDVEKMMAAAFKIRINANTILDEKISKISNIIQNHHGDCKVKIDIYLQNNHIIKIDANNKFNVNPSNKLKQELEDVLGPRSVVLER